MPYIQISTSNSLLPEQKDEIKNRMGELISLIPGKSEAVTMVGITDNFNLYFGGQTLDNGAFIEVRLFGNAEIKNKESLTTAIFEAMKDLLGTAPENIYLNILEMQNWGTEGKLI